MTENIEKIETEKIGTEKIGTEKIGTEKIGTEKIERTNKNYNCTFDTWIGNYMKISKMWEDSYIRLYKPWLESTNTLFEKAIDATNTDSPEKYKEFYDEWTKTFQKNVEKYTQIDSIEYNKKILEKFITSADKSIDICKSWASDIEENSRKTREALKGEPDQIKYKEIYDSWIKLYAKMFDELLTLPFRNDVRDMFETYTGTPDIYSDTFIKISKLWNDSYLKLCGTWTTTTFDLSKKSEEMSKGNIGPEAYKEFYSSWVSIYQQIYGKFLNIGSTKSPLGNDQKECSDQLKATLENFAQSMTVCTNLYKSWTVALSKLSEKSRKLSKQEYSQDAYRETCNLWIRMYQKAFDNILDNIPVATPFKNTMTPIKDAAKSYIDILTKMSDVWVSPVGKVSAT